MESIQLQDLVISSAAFNEDSLIPVKYTCEGEDIHPPLQITNIPAQAKTLAIIVEDPDAPKGIFDHWIAWNIPVAGFIAENTLPGTSGTNGAGKTGYHGPCPPAGYHRYYFYIFALDAQLDLKAGETKQALQKAMDTHIVAKGQLMGRYQKIKQ